MNALGHRTDLARNLLPSTRVARAVAAPAAHRLAVTAHEGNRLAWLASILVVLVLALFANGVRAASEPNDFIEQQTNKVLAQLKSDPAVQSGDMTRIAQIVDSDIMPNVDFERMTALSVGRPWRQATPQQRRQLNTEFRSLLLRTYAGAFSTVRDQTVRMRPFRGDAAKDKEVLVRSEIVQPGAEPVQLDYRLERAADGWKIFDVNVLGVWLIQTYRNQFAQEVSAGGIDGLIKSLQEKNKGGATERRPAKS